MDYKKASIVLKQLQNQFLETIIKNVGKGEFSDDTYEQVQPQKQDDDQDFVFQQEDEGPVPQETQLYKKSIALGPQKKPTINQLPPQLQIQGYNFVYGCNSGNKTMEMVGNSLCRAVGVNVFCQNKIYSAHNQKITYLSYDRKRKILISGTEGKCAEIMLWKCSLSGQKATMQPLFSQRQKKLLNLPLNSLGVGFVWFCAEDLVAVITKFNLHQSSFLYIFDTKLQKRVRSDIKLQKVLDICISSFKGQTILLTETGIWQLDISQTKQCKIVKVLQEDMITVIEIVKIKNEVCILAGKLDGSLKIVSLQNKKIINQIKSHETYINCIRLIDETRFITLAKDQNLVIYDTSQQNQNIKQIQKLNLQESCVNAFFITDSIICVSRSGKVINLNKTNSTDYQKTQNDIGDKMLYNSCSKPYPKQHWIYDRFSKRYIYSSSNSNQIVALSIAQNKQISNIKRFTLSYEPFNLDIVGNIAVYTHRQTKFKEKLKTQTNSSKFNNQELKTQYLILEDYTTRKILNQSIIDLSSCTKLKLSKEGDKLAVGYDDGRIVIYYVNKPAEIIKLKQSKHHSKAIQNIIWSKDSSYLKTISKNNLLYFDLKQSGEEMAPVFSSKSIKDAQWDQVGKFDWSNHKLWQDHLHNIEQIKDIKKTQLYQLVVMQDGKLKLFRNPAGKEGQQLIRLFHNSYELDVLVDNEEQFSVLAMGEGSIFSVNFGPSRENSVQMNESDESFQQIGQ